MSLSRTASGLRKLLRSPSEACGKAAKMEKLPTYDANILICRRKVVDTRAVVPMSPEQVILTSVLSVKLQASRTLHIVSRQLGESVPTKVVLAHGWWIISFCKDT